MCQVGVFSAGVYHKMFALQQFLHKTDCCTQAKGRVVDKGSSSDVAKLTAAIVSGYNDPYDEAFFCVVEITLQVLYDVLIRPPSCEAYHVLQVGRGVVRRQHCCVPFG